MARSFPVGWFERGMLWWGPALDSRPAPARGRGSRCRTSGAPTTESILDLTAARIPASSRPLGARRPRSPVDRRGRLRARISRPTRLARAGPPPWCLVTCAVRRASLRPKDRGGQPLGASGSTPMPPASARGSPARDVRSVAACEAYPAQASSGLESQLRMLAMVHPLGALDARIGQCRATPCT